jgi:transposase
VACSAERGLAPTAAGRIDGDFAPSPVASPSDQAAEIARLRRELDRTRMERDVLKKAIGIFAEMPK